MRAIYSLAAAAALCAAARPAAAQHAAVPDHARPAAHADAGAAAVRPLASYRLAAARRAALPAEVTVADSAGALVASYRLPGTADARPMAVTVIGTDVVLQGETPAGVLTLQLYGQNDADAAAPVEGRWSRAGQEGSLHGRATR